MCGYCIERQAVEIMSCETQGILRIRSTWGAWEYYFYLRESLDFLRALDRLSRSFVRRRIPFFSQVSPHNVLYRGLELLIQDGFNSPRYQQLLTRRLYKEAVATACSEDERKEFEAATDGLDVSSLVILYDADTYLTGKHDVSLNDELAASCKSLLEYYYSWWLLGEGKITTYFDDDGIRRVIVDYARCSSLVRGIFYGLMQAPQLPNGKEMLRRIVETCPAGGPGGADETLWLQRVAALKFYDLEDPNLFYQHLTSFRASIFEYIDIVRKFTPEQKIQLLDEARLYPEELTTDSRLNITEWLSQELADPDTWVKERTAELREASG